MSDEGEIVDSEEEQTEKEEPVVVKSPKKRERIRRREENGSRREERKKDRPMWRKKTEGDVERRRTSSSSSSSDQESPLSTSSDGGEGGETQLVEYKYRKKLNSRNPINNSRKRRRRCSSSSCDSSGTDFEGLPSKKSAKIGHICCKKCDFRGFSKKGMIHHELQTHDLGAQCHLCSLKFHTQEKWKEHYEREHKNDNVKCVFCKSQFEKPFEISEKRWKFIFGHVYGEILYSRLAEDAESD